MKSSCREVVRRIAGDYYVRRLLFLAAAFAILYWGLETVRIIYVFGNLSFWMVLLLPIWIPVVFGKNLQPSAWWRMLLVLPAIAWYLLLIVFPFDYTLCPSNIVLVVGSASAFAMLAFSYQGWWHLVAIPLWVSIFCGTISLLARP